MARRSRRHISLLLVPVQATAQSSGFSVPFALALFVHWAIEVGGICYEVTGEKTQEGKKVYSVKRSSLEEWSRPPGRRDSTIRHRVVGMTDFTNDELWYEGMFYGYPVNIPKGPGFSLERPQCVPVWPKALRSSRGYALT